MSLHGHGRTRARADAHEDDSFCLKIELFVRDKMTQLSVGVQDPVTYEYLKQIGSQLTIFTILNNTKSMLLNFFKNIFCFKLPKTL